jgi:hypothetical protein
MLVELLEFRSEGDRITIDLINICIIQFTLYYIEIDYLLLMNEL